MTQKIGTHSQFNDALRAALQRRLFRLPLRRTKYERLNLFRLSKSSLQVDRLVETLNRKLLPHLRPTYGPVPASALRDQKENYADLLPKTLRFHTADLCVESGKARSIADSLGITALLASNELRKFGERVTAKSLVPEPGRQVICYKPGDFSGPHNDHHPEDDDYRKGYVDIHIMLSPSSVRSQLLIYERSRGLLNEVEEVGKGLSVAVYQLPFWHYVTPLLARSKSPPPYRWLLLATYIIDRSGRKKSR
jgi:hypothetical protein